jgi:type II secretory pathway pseudopilin PulG
MLPVLAIATVDVVVIAVVGALLLLFGAGYLANARRNRVLGARMRAQIEAADAALAEARAQDRGWERELIETAARQVYTARGTGAEIRELHLVQVIDRPGTDADEAVFRVLTADGDDETLVLGRREGAWVPADPH